MRADQWARNGTVYQLAGFDTVRLSSYIPPYLMKQISSQKQLMIGLAPPHAPLDTEYAQDVLDAYPTDGALSRFESWIDSLRWVHDVPVRAIMYNLEVRYQQNARRGSLDEVSTAFAQLVQTYCRIFKRRYPGGQFWTFSGPGPLLESKILYSCDWDLLTSGIDAIDVCYTGGPIHVAPDAVNQVANIARKITDTRDVSNGRDVVWQVMTVGDSESSELRDSYHRDWETFKQTIRSIRERAGDINGHTVPITWYPQHYAAEITLDEGPVTVDYTLDGYGLAPANDLPWPNGGAYPARLWQDGLESRWQDGVANRWELEFVSNFLVGSGVRFPPVIVDEDETWSGTIILPGDLIVRSARLTILSGTEIRFRERSDLSGGGDDPERGEFIVASGGVVAASGTPQRPVIFRSSNVTDADTGDWIGIRNEDGRLELRDWLIRDARLGLDSRPCDAFQNVTFRNNLRDLP